MLVALGRRATVRTAPLGRSNVSGSIEWLGNRRFVLFPVGGDADSVRVYDTSLRVVRRFGEWSARDSAVHGRAAYALGFRGELFRVGLADGRVTQLRILPSPETSTLVAVSGGPVVRRPAARGDVSGATSRPVLLGVAAGGVLALVGVGLLVRARRGRGGGLQH